MPLPLAVPIIAGAARAVAGISGAKKEKRRQRDLIEKAYTVGKQRLDISQGDERQGTAEGLIARGLAGGGSVAAGGPVAPQAPDNTAQAILNAAVKKAGGLGNPGAVNRYVGEMQAAQNAKLVPTPSVTGAHSLGEQEGADLRREQGLTQNALLSDKNTAMSDASAQARQSYVDSIGAGINTGFQVYNLGQMLGGDPISSAMHANGPGTGVVGAGPASPTLPSPYQNPAFGIDPVRPLDRGAWSGKQNSDFHID